MNESQIAELNAIGCVLRRRVEEVLETLDLGDEERARTCLETPFALVA